MKYCQLVVFALFSTVFLACSGDDEPSANLNGGDFFPLATGNEWVYDGSIGYSMEITGNTREINGKTFSEAEINQAGNSSFSYILVEDGDYSFVGFLPNSDELNVTMLRENEPEGTSWEVNNTLNGINTVYEFTIIEKGGSRTVSGEEFNDVIQVQLNTFVEVFGVTQLLASQDIYFARGIGIIQNVIGAFGNSDLIDYTVNN